MLKLNGEVLISVSDMNGVRKVFKLHEIREYKIIHNGKGEGTASVNILTSNNDIFIELDYDNCNNLMKQLDEIFEIVDFNKGPMIKEF